MRSNYFILLILLLVGSTGSSVSSHAISQPAHTPTLVRAVNNQNQYTDVFGWCGNYISDLNRIFRHSNEVARTGNLFAAASELYAGLLKKPLPVEPNPLPHTVEAIRAGTKIARALVSATNQQVGKLGANLVGQVRYAMLADIYTTIQYAFRSLDSEFYMRTIQTCVFGGVDCYGDRYDMLPTEYYDGIRRLAARFVKLQLRMGELQADDLVELNVSEAVAFGARDTLLHSVFRRSLACAIEDLNELGNQIQDELASGSPIPRSWQVQDVRNSLQSIFDRLEDARPYCRGHWPVHGGGL